MIYARRERAEKLMTSKHTQCYFLCSACYRKIIGGPCAHYKSYKKQIKGLQPERVGAITQIEMDLRCRASAGLRSLQLIYEPCFLISSLVGYAAYARAGAVKYGPAAVWMRCIALSALYGWDYYSIMMFALARYYK